MANGKKSPYDVDNDPARGIRNPLQSPPMSEAEKSSDLRRKAKQNIQEEFNGPDPIGDAVRSLWKKVRGS